MNSSNSRIWYIFLFVCVIFDFFHHCLTAFGVQVFCLFRWYIPRYFIIFDAMVNRTASLTSLLDLSLLVYGNASFLILYLAILLNSLLIHLLISSSFLVASLGFSMYRIMSSANSDSFTSPFLFLLL